MPYNKNKIIRQGDIFIADLGEAVGSVQIGVRPVLIIQNDRGNIYGDTTIIIPFTSKLKKKNLPVHITISDDNLKYTGLSEESMLLMEQVRAIDKSQLKNKIGTVNECVLDQAIATMSINFKLGNINSQQSA